MAQAPRTRLFQIDYGATATAKERITICPGNSGISMIKKNREQTRPSKQQRQYSCAEDVQRHAAFTAATTYAKYLLGVYTGPCHQTEAGYGHI